MRSARRVDLGLRLLTAAALLVDAVVHLRLAGDYAHASAPGMINEGIVFRIQAVVAILVAAWVVVRAGRIAFAAAFLVAASAFMAVVLYRYVNLPSFGPFPSMYEPVWYAEKSVSAIAEGIGAIAAATGFVRATRLRPAEEPMTTAAATPPR